MAPLEEKIVQGLMFRKAGLLRGREEQVVQRVGVARVLHAHQPAAPVHAVLEPCMLSRVS